MHSIKPALKEIFQSFQWSNRPQHLAFEINAACDARCIHCPREAMDRPKKPMAFPLFKKLVDEAEDMRIPELFPNGYGEVMLLNNLEDYLNYIRSKKHVFKIMINTNGHLMDERKIDLLFKYKVNYLNITIDGATAETAEKVRVNLNHGRIEKNIRTLLNERSERKVSYPNLRVGMVLIEENKHEAGLFLKKWEGVSDYVSVSGFSNRGSSVKNNIANTKRVSSKVSICKLPFRELNIWVDGKAVICCQDWNEEEVVGDLNSQTLHEIWHGNPLREIRGKHLCGKGHEIDICRKCNFWSKPVPGTFLKPG